MAPDTTAPNPTSGGSYVRHADGSLEQVEGPRAAAEAPPGTPSGDAGSDAGAETPAGLASAGA